MSSDYTWELEQFELSISMHFSFNTEPATVHMLRMVCMGHISDLALHVNCWLLSMSIVMLASTSVNLLVICVPLSLSFSEPLSFKIWVPVALHYNIQNCSHHLYQLLHCSSLYWIILFFIAQKVPYMLQFSQNSTKKKLATEILHSYLPRSSQSSPITFNIIYTRQ